MDFLVKFFAQLFDKFKVQNPATAAVLLFILGALHHAATNGTALGIFTLPEWSQQPLYYLTLFLTAVTGSRTYQHLNK